MNECKDFINQFVFVFYTAYFLKGESEIFPELVLNWLELNLDMQVFSVII